LVASPRNRDAAREAHLLHEGRGPDLRGRVLQAVDVRHVHALSLFAASSAATLSHFGEHGVVGVERALPSDRGRRGLVLSLRPHRFCVTLCVTRCMKMGRSLMTWDNEG